MNDRRDYDPERDRCEAERAQLADENAALLGRSAGGGPLTHAERIATIDVIRARERDYAQRYQPIYTDRAWLLAEVDRLTEEKAETADLLATMTDHAERATVLLRGIEWGAVNYQQELVCPECDGAKAAGHKPGCALSALLA